MIRRALTLLLLLLFITEIVALASALRPDKESPVLSVHELVSPELSPLFSVLAEGQEERDQRNDVLLPVEREVLHPYEFPRMEQGKVFHTEQAEAHGSVRPLYTLHHILRI